MSHNPPTSSLHYDCHALFVKTIEIIDQMMQVWQAQVEGDSSTLNPINTNMYMRCCIHYINIDTSKDN